MSKQIDIPRYLTPCDHQHHQELWVRAHEKIAALEEEMNKIIRQMWDVETERDSLRAALKQCAEALQEAKWQWGDDYLWEKLINDECLDSPGVQAVLDRAERDNQ